MLFYSIVFRISRLCNNGWKKFTLHFELSDFRWCGCINMEQREKIQPKAKRIHKSKWNESIDRKKRLKSLLPFHHPFNLRQRNIFAEEIRYSTKMLAHSYRFVQWTLNNVFLPTANARKFSAHFNKRYILSVHWIKRLCALVTQTQRHR